jgi:hypothetical protein
LPIIRLGLKNGCPGPKNSFYACIFLIQVTAQMPNITSILNLFFKSPVLKQYFPENENMPDENMVQLTRVCLF